MAVDRRREGRGDRGEIEQGVSVFALVVGLGVLGVENRQCLDLG
jgi:hypothetical protein